MSNMMKFEFDFDEVLEGIKQGVIREMADVDRNVVLGEVIRDIKNQCKLNYNDISNVKSEIMENVKSEVLESIEQNILERNKKEIDKTLEDIKSDKDEYLTIIRDEIIESTTNELVSILRKEIQSKVNQQVQSIVYNIFNNAGANNINIKNTNNTLSQEEYEELKEKEMFLEALKQCGVDNWEGYSFACERLNEWIKDDNK